MTPTEKCKVDYIDRVKSAGEIFYTANLFCIAGFMYALYDALTQRIGKGYKNTLFGIAGLLLLLIVTPIIIAVDLTFALFIAGLITLQSTIFPFLYLSAWREENKVNDALPPLYMPLAEPVAMQNPLLEASPKKYPLDWEKQELKDECTSSEEPGCICS